MAQCRFFSCVLDQQSWPRGSFMVAHAAILFYEETGGGALLLRWLPSAAHNNFAAPWLAYMLLCRRFADCPRGRLRKARADVGRLLHLRGVSPHLIRSPGALTCLRPARLLTARAAFVTALRSRQSPSKIARQLPGYRQFPAWNLPPLVMQALGAHGLL